MENLILYGRANCSHCEQLRFALDLLKNSSRGTNLPQYVYIDIDSDPDLQEAYGIRVPVLVWGSKTICDGVFDIETLEHDLFRTLSEVQ